MSFLKQPHQELTAQLRAVIDGQTVPIADFTKLPTRCKFIAFMPQWDFLNFLSTHAKKFPSFQLLMEHEVVDLTFDQQRVTGVRAKTPRGELEIRADLVIGADGRHSIIQACAGLERQEFGVADRCALDADLKEAGRSSAITRLLSTRQIARVTRPRRLLAVRLRNSQRAASMTSKHAVCSNFKTTSSASPDFSATAWQSSMIGPKSNC